MQWCIGLQEYKERASALFEEAVYEFKKTHPTFTGIRVGPHECGVVNLCAKIACLGVNACLSSVDATRLLLVGPYPFLLVSST